MRQTMRTVPPESPTQPPEASDALDALDTGIDISVADILDRIWRFFISKVTGLVLILAMGLLSLIGTLLSQAPGGMRGDPQAYASWLDSVRPKYGGWTSVLNTLGMFNVFSSIWFKSVSVLLAVSILACSINRAPQLWQRAFRPRVHVVDSFFIKAALRAEVTVPLPPAAAFERVQTMLRRHRFRTIVDPKGSGLNLYSDRFRFGPFGTVIAHVSFVLILMGVLLTAATGFKNNQFAAPVGSRVEVGHGTGLAVEAQAFSDSYYLDGSPKDYASDLVLYKDGKRVARKTVRVNSPLRWGGIAFHQSFFGTAASMQVKDDTGKSLFDSGVPLVWTSDDGKHSIGQFALPAKGLSVYVVGAASGQVDPNIGAGQMQLEIYQSGKDQPVSTQVVSQGKPATISGLTFTFARELQFTGLIVSQDPGALWVWIGSTLMVIGLFLVFFFPHRRVWVRVRRSAEGAVVYLASPMRRDSRFESQFRQFAADLELVGAPDEQQPKVGPEDA